MAYSVELANAQYGTCVAAIQPGGQCSGECRNSLLAIRDELGCCINAFYNNTALYAVYNPVLSYPLWSRCNVEPPNSTCDGEIPFTLPAAPLRICTLNEILACTEDSIEGIRNSINGEPSCEVFLQYNLDVCSRMDASDDGACIVELGTDLAVIPSLTSSCGAARFTQSCSESCRESLEDFIERRGCCVNTLYNSTYSQVTGLNNSAPFFQDNVVLDLCGVETPPLTCGTDGLSLPLKSFTMMMLLPLIITALLGNKI